MKFSTVKERIAFWYGKSCGILRALPYLSNRPRKEAREKIEAKSKRWRMVAESIGTNRKRSIAPIEPFGEPPHPDNSPVLVLYDHDLGWIIEAVNDGEYEVQDLIHVRLRGGFCYPPIDRAIEIAEQRGVRVKYYHNWNQA